jgi:hypothetical protein
MKVGLVSASDLSLWLTLARAPDSRQHAPTCRGAGDYRGASTGSEPVIGHCRWCLVSQRLTAADTAAFGLAPQPTPQI